MDKVVEVLYKGWLLMRWCSNKCLDGSITSLGKVVQMSHKAFQIKTQDNWNNSWVKMVTEKLWKLQTTP